MSSSGKGFIENLERNSVMIRSQRTSNRKRQLKNETGGCKELFTLILVVRHTGERRYLSALCRTSKPHRNRRLHRPPNLDSGFRRNDIRYSGTPVVKFATINPYA